MLDRNEIAQLVDRLAKLYDFTSTSGRRTLIEVAGLGRFVPGLQLDAASRTVAGSLITKLEDFGPLGKPSTFHALGALLAYLADQDDLPIADRQFYARLILKYSLSSDPQYLDSLRGKFDIDQEPTRAPDQVPSELPRPGAVATGPQPEFEPAVTDPLQLERIVNSEDNFLDICLLEGALRSSRGVCLVEAPKGAPIGTGFLVASDLVLTNQHVVPSQAALGEVCLRFDYLADPQGGSSQGHTFRLKTDFYKSSEAHELDYALLRVETAPLAEMSRSQQHRGYLPVSGRLVVKGERVNIIQHPRGQPMKVVLTQNYVVTEMTDARIQYVADTLDGSSGSPIFDRYWNVVGIHHSGRPYPPDSAGRLAKRLIKGNWVVNEGVAMRAILDQIKQHLPQT